MRHPQRFQNTAFLGLLVGSLLALDMFRQPNARADGPLTSWGSNSAGQRTPPSWLGRIRAVSGGYTHTMALRSNGSVVCWGSSNEGQLAVPSGLSEVVDISAGYFHNVALRANGQVVCWGFNVFGQCSVPSDLPPIRAVAAGEGHTVALSSDDRVFQWGDVYASVPTDIGRVARIAAGQYHSMALRFDGTVRCWGDGSWGQCATPANLVGARAIAAGALHSIVLRSDQTVQCWGRGDNGQLNVPSGLTSVVAIAGGGAHSAALREDGTVAAWGLNANGQSSPPRLPFTRQLDLGFSHSVSVDCGVDIDLRNSPDLGAVGFGAAKTHTFTSLPPTSNGGVTLEIIARADLDLTSEFLLVTLDGQGPGSVLFATTGSANDCPIEPNRATINLTAATYASLAADGEIQVQVESSIGVNASQCAVGSLVLELAVPKFPTDCNGNGVEDSCDVRTRSDVFDCDQNGAVDFCEIISSQNLDCDQDGRLDWCQIAGGAQDKDADGVLDSCEFAIGDFDLNGVVGGPDLATLLALWGVPKPPYGDLDRNGNVGGGDLAIMLNNWGPVN